MDSSGNGGNNGGAVMAMGVVTGRAMMTAYACSLRTPTLLLKWENPSPTHDSEKFSPTHINT